MERTFRDPLRVRASRRANNRDLLRDDHIRAEVLKNHCDFARVVPPSIISGQGGIPPC
jgi:hypothetical protein